MGKKLLLHSFFKESAKRRDLCLQAVVCCALAVCEPVTASRDGENLPAFEPRMPLASSSLVPGIVIDTRRETVYIMRPGGGIESVKLADGDVQWDSKHADMPLFVDDEVLYARLGVTAPGLLVERLKTEDGTPVSKNTTQLLRLPEGIAARLDNTLGITLRQSVVSVGDQTYLTWQYVERSVNGVAPADGLGLVRQERGAFRYTGGSFEASSTGLAPSAGDDWPVGLRVLMESGQLPGAPWKTADYFSSTRQTSAPEMLILKRWHRNNGEPLPDRILFDGRPLAVLAACDERFVVISVPNINGAPETPYRLRYFSLTSGSPVAEFSSSRSAAPFCIKGSRLLVVSQPFTRRENGALVHYPLELIVRNLATGTEIWRRAIRDIAYRGSAPPRTDSSVSMTVNDLNGALTKNGGLQ